MGESSFATAASKLNDSSEMVLLIYRNLYVLFKFMKQK